MLDGVSLGLKDETALRSSDGAANGFEIGLDEGIDLVSPVGSSPGFNDGKLDVSLDYVSLG